MAATRLPFAYSALAPKFIATASVLVCAVAGPCLLANIVVTFRNTYSERYIFPLNGDETLLLQLSERVEHGRKRMSQEHGHTAAVAKAAKPGENTLSLVVFMCLLLIVSATIMYIDDSSSCPDSLSETDATYLSPVQFATVEGSRQDDRTPLPPERHVSIKPSALPAPMGRPVSAGSAQSSTIAEPRVPAGQRITLAVPVLLEAPSDELRNSDFQVSDLTGKTLLSVSVMVPPRDLTETDQSPREYVTLYSTNGEDELAMCALGPQSSQYWRCDVYHRGDALFGHIVHEDNPHVQSPAVSFSLIDTRKERLLSIGVEPGGASPSITKQRRITVFDQSGNKCADATPGAFSFGHGGQYYQADCLPDADLGIIVIALMGVDRLLSNRRPIRTDTA